MAETVRVLVVDDETGMRTGIQRALRHFVVRLPDVGDEIGLEIETAATGEEAIDLIGRFMPDLVLLDHKLPGISGLDVLRWIHDQHLDLLTVMITAYASLDTAIKATKRGAYDFLAKPFTPMELKAAVRKAVKHLVIRRQVRRLAEERRQVRFQFLSVLSHELKAPLGAIEGFLRIVRDRTAGDDEKVYEHLLDRSLDRLAGMRKMIYDLLDLTRIEAGTKQRELGVIDVVDCARTALETTAAEAAARDITVALHADEPVEMTADRSEIEIIFNNLLTNAVKYNRDGGRVDVHVARSGESVRIAVEDTGIGMNEEEAARLFQDFVRIRNERTRGIPGSGLGLSTVKKLTELYDGSVAVSSTPGTGSTFTVTLNANAQPRSATDPEAMLVAAALDDDEEER
jgi:signal transduction histidine kinase